jgi:peptide/nickel transport system permease protein
VRRRPLALAALAVLLAIIVGCYAAPWLAPYRPDATNLFGTLRGPSPAHLLGTDELGRDILSRLMYGGRATLTEAALVVVVTLGLGLPAGLLAGFAGGWTDRVIMYLADIGLALPVIVIILLVLAIFNGNLQVAMVGMGVLLVPPLARIIRSAALAVRAEPYVDAARVSGVRPARIIIRHVLPRVRGTILTQASIVAALALLFTTGLAYLGFGPAAPSPSWGSMTAEADQVLAHSPWLLVASGGAIGLTVLCLGLVGDALRDITTGAWTGQADPAPGNPRFRRRHPPADAAGAGGAGGGEGAGGDGRTGAEGAGAGAEGAGPEGAEGAGAEGAEALLRVRGLTVTFPRGEREVAVTQGVSLEVRAGETVGLVGESGCGKTSVARAIVGLLRGGGRVAAGRVYFGGRDVTSLAGREARRYRGGQVALITQEPMASLDPSWRVGALVAQAVRCHKPMPKAAAAVRVRELFELVRLPDPDRVARLYPHELSGGMAQRVAIARALAGNPSLLVADEPTTALDVTLQAEILALLRTLQRETGLAVLIVSHDWQVVADSCDRVIVMYAGQVVEQAPAADILGSPRHPYTRLLLAASTSSAPDGAQSLPVIAGTIPAPEDWPPACHFGARCPHATDACHAGPVPLSPVPPVSVAGRLARCVRVGELAGSAP